jgi:DNA-binding transcriptional MocR family regulator
MALQYGETEGYKPLRDMIASRIARYGIKAQAETRALNAARNAGVPIPVAFRSFEVPPKN